MGKYALGQSVPRSEDPRLLRGGGRYADDRSMPGMAHGYVLRSPHAHAGITGINIEAAVAAPGVLAWARGEHAAGHGHRRQPAGAHRGQVGLRVQLAALGGAARLRRDGGAAAMARQAVEWDQCSIAGLLDLLY